MAIMFTSEEQYNKQEKQASLINTDIHQTKLLRGWWFYEEGILNY